MSQQQKKLLLIGILAFVLLSANIGGYSIYITDEARNAQCAREMFERRDWIVPTFNQSLRTDKPPLHYFFMAASYSVLGVNPYSARFFSAVFGTLLVLITFVFTKSFISEKAANWSVITLISSLGFITQFHLAVPDPYLIFFTSAGLISYFYFDQLGQKKYLYLAYAAIGLGVLAKGPVAIVIPGGILFFYLLLRKKLTLKEIIRLKPLIGLLIVLIISVPWYLLVHIKTNGEWTTGFFLDHNINRFSSPKEGHGGSFLLPTAFAFMTLLPLSIFLPQAFVKSWQEKSNPILLFSMIAVVLIVLFFSISSTKLPSYISPIFPFAAVIIGNYISKIESNKRKSFWIPALIFLIITTGIWFGVFQFVPKIRGLESLTQLHFFFIPAIVFALISFLVGMQNSRNGLVGIALTFLIFHQVFFYFVFPKIDELNPVNKTASVVKDAENLVYYRRMNQAYPWMLGEEVKNARTINNLDSILSVQPNTLIISRPRYLEELNQLELKEIQREVDILDGTKTILLRKDN